MLARDLGWRSVAELRRGMPNSELVQWAAFYDQEHRLRETAERHPKWGAEKCWEFLKAAFNLHLQDKRTKRLGKDP